MAKKIMITAICVISILVLIYLVIGFIIMDFNIIKWSVYHRFFLVCIALLISIPFSIAINDDFKK